MVATTPPAERRSHDAVRTRGEILDAATAEFADRGFTGARTEEIAARTRTSKRMIYYYFGSKAGLFTAVLEEAYRRIRQVEEMLDPDGEDAVATMRRLAELTFDHHEEHAEFIRLVSVANIHRGRHLAASREPAALGAPALAVIDRILRRGRDSGQITAEVDAVGMHALISSFCVFRVANRHTFAVLFGADLLDVNDRGRYRAMLGDMVVGYLTGAAAPADRTVPDARATPLLPAGSRLAAQPHRGTTAEGLPSGAPHRP